METALRVFEEELLPEICLFGYYKYEKCGELRYFEYGA